MACKAYRDYGKEVNGIKRPEIVAPITVHSAFDKAAQYLKMRLTYVKVDPQTYQVDIKAFKRAITSNTVMVIFSQYFLSKKTLVSYTSQKFSLKIF